MAQAECVLNCVEGLVCPLLQNAFESTLDGVLNDTPPYLGRSDFGTHKENAYWWMNDHYEQAAGVLNAIAHMTHELHKLFDSLPPCYGLDVDRKTDGKSA